MGFKIMNWDTIDRNADCVNYPLIEKVYANLCRNAGEETNFSPNNRKYLLEYLNKLKNCNTIVEIGVENNVDKNLTSTSTILKTKNNSTIYVGIDLENKSHLDNNEKNIFTLQSPSENIEKVVSFIKSKNIEKIDFLFIDGWHSINQCIIEFEGYSPLLSEDGIIGVHDINHHPGPRWLMENIDKSIWEIAEYPGNLDSDFGIGFIWKKNITKI